MLHELGDSSLQQRGIYPMQAADEFEKLSPAELFVDEGAGRAKTADRLCLFWFS